jgi:trimeric autotransporter adhesin
MRFIGYCLSISLVSLSLVMLAGCSCQPAAAPAPAPVTVTVTAAATPTPSTTAIVSVKPAASPTSTLNAAPTLSSISISPVILLNIQVGVTQQFTAMGHYSNDSVANITSQVTWASSDSNAATITSPGGLVTGVAVGATDITASLSGVTSNSINLPVIPHIISSFTPTGMNGTSQ